MRVPLLVALGALLVIACGDDGEPSSEADRLGVGAECAADDECQEGQACLAFKGGYCGIKDCTDDEGCPEGSACVAHDNGSTYCFRTCGAKTDCNRNRAVANESNCSSSVTFIEDAGNRKACVPPSGT